MKEQNYYTYLHRRADDNQIFYVGKGKENRAWRPYKRNRWWHNVANKHGYKVELILENVDERIALDTEIKVIAYGRAHNWPLVNQTDGGDNPPSPKGRTISIKTRKKLSQSLLGNSNGKGCLGIKSSIETRKKLSESHKGLISGMKGKHHTEETRKKMSQAKTNYIPWNKGKLLSISHKKHLRDAWKKRRHREEIK